MERKFLLSSFYIVLQFFFKSNDAVIFKLTNIECHSYNESRFVFSKCRLKAISRDRTAAYIYGNLFHSSKALSVNFQLFKRANGYKPWLIKGEVDVCRFLRKPYNPTAMLIGSLFLEFTNFNHTCPYLGPIIVEGFYLRPEVLKLPLPTGDYLLAISWFFDTKFRVDTNASFTFSENLIDQ